MQESGLTNANVWTTCTYEFKSIIFFRRNAGFRKSECNCSVQINLGIKGTVQQDLRRVKSGING
jgi:hypothetical protein